MKSKLILFGLFLSVGVFTYAGSVTFSFDQQTINGTTIPGLASGATSAQIQTYMNQVLAAGGCTGCSVTVLVSGTSIGAVADQTYNGDGHVTGPGTGATSLTLGNSNGATASNTSPSLIGPADTFISNTNDSSGTVSQQITLQFNKVTGLAVNSFDYEIFPDGTCAVLNTSCGGSGNPNQPDLEFEAGTNLTGTDTLVTSFGTGGIALGVKPGNGNGTSTLSPLSNGSAELAPQLIGTWAPLSPLTGVSELDFVDWPATIGIDNLKVSFTTPSPVPEPGSVVLFGTLLVLLAKKLRRA